MTAKRPTHGRFDRFRSESGVSLIHVGMLMFVFMGLSMFVVDYGVVWLARVQAQNAADGGGARGGRGGRVGGRGAAGGGAARGWDDWGAPPAANGASFQSAFAAARAH